jgi:DNA-directed RNA polymerase subunit RPC12/RpoP
MDGPHRKTAYESIMLQAFFVNCEGCGARVPVNDIAESISCSRCGHHIALREFWTDSFAKSVFGTIDLEPKVRKFLDVGRALDAEGIQCAISGSPSAELKIGRQSPTCQGCKGQLDPAALAASLDAGACSCPACGARVRLRRADALCLAMRPTLRLLVGEGVGGAVEGEMQKLRQPVLFACMGCGANLPVDGTARMVTCTYCNAPNYLPDGLWQAINPVPKMTPLFLVCEHDERARYMSRLQDRGFACTEAQKPSLPHEAYAALAAHEESEVRRTLAQNPAAPLDLLEQLALDSDPDVSAPARETVALLGGGDAPKKGFFRRLFGG